MIEHASATKELACHSSSGSFIRGSAESRRGMLTNKEFIKMAEFIYRKWNGGR